MIYISFCLLLATLTVVTEGRVPLIAYTGQPLELSVNGLRSVEANKAAKYAAEQILDEKLRIWNLPPCVAVIPEILFGTYKVVAGMEYNLHLRLAYKSIPNQDPNCRTARGFFQDEQCNVVVVYQPYKPIFNATLALLNKQCQENAPFFPESGQ